MHYFYRQWLSNWNKMQKIHIILKTFLWTGKKHKYTNKLATLFMLRVKKVHRKNSPGAKICLKRLWVQSLSLQIFLIWCNFQKQVWRAHEKVFAAFFDPAQWFGHPWVRSFPFLCLSRLEPCSSLIWLLFKINYLFSFYVNAVALDNLFLFSQSQ